MSALLKRQLIRSPFKIALCLTEKDFRATLKKQGVKKSEWPLFLEGDSLACNHTFDLKKNKKLAVVCVSKKMQKKARLKMYLTLTHEAIHIWQECHSYINEGDPSGEFEAYSIERLSKRLIKEFIRRTT